MNRVRAGVGTGLLRGRVGQGALLISVLLAACGRNPSPRPPSSPAPGMPPTPRPATVTLCHLEISKTGGWTWQSLDLGPEDASVHSDHKRDHPGACDGSEPGPPKVPSPAPKPTAAPQADKVTICHVFDRYAAKDRGRETITVNPKLAEWHLTEHKAFGDKAGPCPEREK